MYHVIEVELQKDRMERKNCAWMTWKNAGNAMGARWYVIRLYMKFETIKILSIVDKVEYSYYKWIFC